MKTAHDNSIIAHQTSGVMPPRWGLELVGNVAGYKHVAPLALGKQ